MAHRGADRQEAARLRPFCFAWLTAGLSLEHAACKRMAAQGCHALLGRVRSWEPRGTQPGAHGTAAVVAIGRRVAEGKNRKICCGRAVVSRI